MDRLTKSSFFLMVAHFDALSSSQELAFAYREFMHQMMSVCLNTKENIPPPFFIINFIRVELMLLQQERKKNNNVEGDNVIDSYIHKALLSVSCVLKWLKLNKPSFVNERLVFQTMEFIPQWTAGTIDLIEMAMSLHARKAINNGDISITDTVNLLFGIFKLNPGNFFSTYGVMRNRAKSRTLFLDELKSSIERKMDRDDNREIRHKKNK